MMQHEKFVSTAPVSDIWEYFDSLESPGQQAVAPLVYINERDNRKTERISGCAVFSKDKMIGTLTGEETKYMLFVTNKIKGGIIPVHDKKGKPAFSLEIFSNKTKIKPVRVDGKLQMQISTVTKTGLDEVMIPKGFPDFEKKKEIEELAEQQMRKNILEVIHKAQMEYKADIFGFGENIHMNMPKEWKKLKNNWDESFPLLQVVVKPEVIIETSAKTTRSIRIVE